MTTTEVDGPAREQSASRVIGVGASAEGLASLRALLRALPADAGLAVVVVPQVAGAGDDAIVEDLRQHSAMPVESVKEITAVGAGRIYVAMSSQDVVLDGRELRPVAPEPTAAGRAPLDRFFRSLAAAQGRDACGILLSAVGADGASGLKAIKEAGGLTIAQEPAATGSDGIPRAAIASGFVDLVVSAAEIPERLIQILRDGSSDGIDTLQRSQDAVADALRDILTFLRVRSGHDFGSYKRATLLRRIARRMQVCETESIGTYLKFLREHPSEVGALLRDFLISVTGFFRDREAFSALELQVLPRIFGAADHDAQIRLWIPGCATGEEAYSLAILCAEHRARAADPPAVQIFATDIDDGALAEARAGRYPDTIAADLTEPRLHRWFIPDGPSYRIKKEIREMVLFSSHNVLRDPPFSRLDLISCRNLLIYLNRDAQDRVLGAFHFGLRPHGYLFLGSSESAETAAMLFAPVDGKFRIYSRRPASTHLALAAASLPARSPQAPTPAASTSDRSSSFGELHHRLVERYAPPSVLVNDDLEIMHLSEHAGRFLVVAGGEPTRNLMRLVHPDLRLDLRAAVYAARHPDSGHASRPVRLTLDGRETVVQVHARTFGAEYARDLVLVVFDEQPAGAAAVGPAGEPTPIEPMVQQLEDELHQVRDQLRVTVEQYETSVEELKASNEELHAINEELRSATEELETSKEELQSVNEELTTLNNELNDKIVEVSRANSDLQNLITSTEIGVLFLDREMRIQRFTPRTQDLFNVIATDVGRPLVHLTHRLDAGDLTETAREVLQTLRPIERDVRDVAGRHYLVRVHPYRSVEDRIDGVVLSFLDVTALKRAEQTVRSRETMLQLAERAAEAGMWELDIPRRMMRMSAECARLHGYEPGTEEVELTEWLARIHNLDRARVGDLIRGACDGGRELDFEFRIIHPTRGLRWLWLTGKADVGGGATTRAVAGLTVDVTARRRTEAALRASEERFRLALRTAPVLMLNQDLDLRYTWGYMLGGPVEFVGKSDADLFPPAEAARLTALKRSVLDTGAGRREEIALTVDGRLHYYDYNVEPIDNETGRIRGVSSAAVDVTSSKLAELSLRDADRRKDEFLATLAHELRNPLAPLVAALDIQQLAGGDLARIDQARAIMERQVAHIVRLVDDLLDISRITQGKIHLRTDRITASSIVDAAIESLRPALDEAEHELVVTMSPEPIELEGDFARLSQVLVNLLSNAIKYTPPGGRIEIAAGRDGEQLVLRVRDDGAGIAPELLPHVFDMFVQADAAARTSGGGLGVGLALVRQLVELHGGTVEARSEGAGRGTEMIVRMPLSRDRTAPTDPRERRGRARTGQPQKVLVVDDNRDVADAVCALLRIMGHEPRDANDGVTALEVYDEFRPTIVLLDIGMPGMNGYEVARRMRQKPGGRETVIVAVTGWGQTEDRARSREAGFDHHLVKPAGLAALREIVGDVAAPP